MITGAHESLIRRLIVVCVALVAACASAQVDASPRPPELAALYAPSFPVDAAEPGGARAVWRTLNTPTARAAITESAALLDADERINPALWALVRAERGLDPSPAATPDEFAARFEREWALVDAMFAALPAPTNLSEELFRRDLQQAFGRRTLSLLWQSFPPGEARAAAQTRVWAKLTPLDVANTLRLQAILADRAWLDDAADGPGAQDLAWQIVQHSDENPDFQRAMLTRLEPMLAAGRVRAQDYALLWDRVAVKDGRPQRYGSQMRCENGTAAPIGGVEAPGELDQRRAAMNLEPWEPYRARLAQLMGDCPA